MQKPRFSGKLGPGLDPCAVIRLPFELADGQEEREIVFVARRWDSVLPAPGRRIPSKCFRGTESACTALVSGSGALPDAATSGSVNVDTPDSALQCDGEWLGCWYQTLAVAVFSGSDSVFTDGQSGGAFGLPLLNQLKVDT